MSIESWWLIISFSFGIAIDVLWIFSIRVVKELFPHIKDEHKKGTPLLQLISIYTPLIGISSLFCILLSAKLMSILLTGEAYQAISATLIIFTGYLLYAFIYEKRFPIVGSEATENKDNPPNFQLRFSLSTVILLLTLFFAVCLLWRLDLVGVRLDF